MSQFLFAKYKVELTKISVFIISRRSLPTVLICWSCCQNHLFVSYPLPPRVFSIFDQEFGGKTKQKIIWYVSSTTNCFYKENIDIIYRFTGVYRKDITLTILSQVILFVFVSQVFSWPLDVGSPPQLFNYFCEINSSGPLYTLTNYALLSIQSCAIQSGWWPSPSKCMIFKSRLVLRENHFMSKFASQSDFSLSRRVQNFRLHYISPTFVAGFNRRWEEGNVAKCWQNFVQKCHFVHFERGATTSLAILTGGPLWVRPSNRLKV